MNSLLSGVAPARYRGIMGPKPRQIVRFCVAALLAGGLAGCAPGALSAPTPVETAASPAPSATGSPTPTSSAPVAARVQVDGDSVSVEAADDSTIVDIPYSTDAATAATQFGSAVGLPATISTSPAGSCAVATTVYSWGGFELRAPGGFAAAPGALFVARSQAPTTSSGLPVVMPGGQGVGTPVSEVLASNPTLPMEGDPAGNSVIYFHVLSGHPLGQADTFYGAAAFANGGFVTSLASPIYYYYDC